VLLRDIARRLGCRLEGDGEIEIARVAGLESAGPGDLTFFSNPRYAPLLAQTSASAVIAGDQAPAAPCAMLRSANPYLSFAEALDLFGSDDRPPRGIHPTSVVAEDAAIGRDAIVGAYVVIGPGARIGDRAVLHPHVVVGRGAIVGDDAVLHAHASVREGCVLGRRVVLQNGAVIGSDGYGFVTRADGSHRKIPQRALVVLEDDVEIQAHSCIDRAAMGETRIKRGSKIDNLVQIGHAVVIGESGVLNNKLRFEDEFVRHKMLDAIGDLALLGHPVVGQLEAVKAGHALHAALARTLLETKDAWALVAHPQFPVLELRTPPAAPSLSSTSATWQSSR